MTEIERKKEEAWEAWENMDRNDPNYSSAMRKYFDLSDEWRVEGAKEFREISRKIMKSIQDLENTNEELESELVELRLTLEIGS